MENQYKEIIKKLIESDSNNQKVLTNNSVSNYDLNEIETLDNKEFLFSLVGYVEKEKSKIKRDKVYNLLADIAKQSNENTAIESLIQMVTTEPDKTILSGLLLKIRFLKKPIGINLQPLITATKSDKWLIRYSAIQSFENTLDIIAETTLIDILESSEDYQDLIYANATLYKIGSLNAIRFIEKHLTSKKKDVKDSAKLAIEEIIKRKS